MSRITNSGRYRLADPRRFRNPRKRFRLRRSYLTKSNTQGTTYMDSTLNTHSTASHAGISKGPKNRELPTPPLFPKLGGAGGEKPDSEECDGEIGIKWRALEVVA